MKQRRARRSRLRWRPIESDADICRSTFILSTLGWDSNTMVVATLWNIESHISFAMVNISFDISNNYGGIQQEAKPRPYALLLAIVPLMTVFGNVLVMLAVCREKSLHTVTNFLIVSLAVSDFLVGFVIREYRER